MLAPSTRKFCTIDRTPRKMARVSTIVCRSSQARPPLFALRSVGTATPVARSSSVSGMVVIGTAWVGKRSSTELMKAVVQGGRGDGKYKPLHKPDLQKGDNNPSTSYTADRPRVGDRRG